MNLFPMYSLTEAGIEGIINSAGGSRAHPDAERRSLKGADFILDDALVELKLLEDEGFSKSERQKKLASLFWNPNDGRPVVVLDPMTLGDSEQKKYRNIVEGPIKNDIAKARKQLQQSRTEFPNARGSILWIVNNGYMALDHEKLKDVVANRARQDTSSIDGVIVSGCYFHSDGFEGRVFWPIDYVPINVVYNFSVFDKIRAEWNAFATSFMTDAVRGHQKDGQKLSVSDIVFEVNGITYVRPAPTLGEPSDFYVNGRPRENSSGIEECPPVAIVMPSLSCADHAVVLSMLSEPYGPLASYEKWKDHLKAAEEASNPKKPLVTIPVSSELWLRWCNQKGRIPSISALKDCALDLFHARIRDLIIRASERKSDSVLLSSYMLAVTEEIGQDRANDVSHIAAVREFSNGKTSVLAVAENLRMFHEHAVALAAAYSFLHGKDAVLWQKNRVYGWT
ncbi:MAG TPA: hypothetical protein PKA59_08255 [Chakrabartia sp.]|jgi:hypothetical protein|nr:hypothetical protein [Chakrabartia sp.]